MTNCNANATNSIAKPIIQLQNRRIQLQTGQIQLQYRRIQLQTGRIQLQRRRIQLQKPVIMEKYGHWRSDCQSYMSHFLR